MTNDTLIVCPRCGGVTSLLSGDFCECRKKEAALYKYDTDDYVKFCTKAVADKALNTLEGILEGISIDEQLDTAEVEELKFWCDINSMLIEKQPYNELFRTISAALEDGVLTLEEKEDLLWLSKRLHSDGLYYDAVTADLQKLQGILCGIIADEKITKEELEGLQDWLADNEQLATYYPYDEIYSLVTSVLKDGVVTKEEEELLKGFFSQFVFIKKAGNAVSSEVKQSLEQYGICALAPEIDFAEHVFCFTGKSTKAKRQDIANLVEDAGGIYNDRVTKETNYLIIGNNGNQCWAFSCYGRKVEKAMNMRKQGANIILVNEVDFWDCF